VLQTRSRERFEVLKDLVSKCLSKVESKLAALEGSDLEYAHKSVAAFFLAKAFKTYQAAYLLSDHGYHQDAAVLARTIFEILLQISYIATDAKRAELFLKHDPVDRYYLFLRFSKFPELVEGIANRERELATLKADFDELKADYSKNKGWWGTDLRSLAELSGKEKDYLRLYPLYSPLVHSTSTSVKYYVEEGADGLHLDFNPSDAGAKLAGFDVASEFVLIVAHMAASAWDLSDDAAKLLDEAKRVARADRKSPRAAP
jgi:hypothetical protein